MPVRPASHAGPRSSRLPDVPESDAAPPTTRTRVRYYRIGGVRGSTCAQPWGDSTSRRFLVHRQRYPVVMADRSGTEPATARSPLRLRMVLAVFGIAVCGLVAVLAWSWRDEGEASALTAGGAVAGGGAAAGGGGPLR